MMKSSGIAKGQPCLTERTLPLDSSGIIHLAALRPDHSNVFRLSVETSFDVDAKALQQAVEVLTARFPALFAGIHPGFYDYRVTACEQPPCVVEDRRLLAYMGPDEIRRCGTRVMYGSRSISLEIFHSLTDGHGAIVAMNTLLAAYAELALEKHVKHGEFVLDPAESPRDEEVRDDYPVFAKPPAAPPNRRRVYQLPGSVEARDAVRKSTLEYPADMLLAAARRHGVSLTTFLTAVMFEAVADIQRAQTGCVREPLQIAVPANARRLLDSVTLRNFSLLALPCVEAHEGNLPFAKLVDSVEAQLKAQFEADHVAHAMESYVKSQGNPLFRLLPLKLKTGLARMVHHAFGARNSCITLSNLGVVHIAPELAPLVRAVELALTPRIESPYNCGVASHGGVCRVAITRFCEVDELTPAFRAALEGKLPPAGTRLSSAR